jgi:hypothetical protein
MLINNGYNDIQLNDTQHNDIQHNNIQHNGIQHNIIQHNDIQHSKAIQAWIVSILMKWYFIKTKTREQS